MRSSRTVVAALCAVLAGCTHNVNVALTPDYSNGLPRDNVLAAVRPALSFSRGQFSDRRADTTRLAHFKQGAQTYNLVAERRPQDALFDGVRAVLTQAGHSWADTGKADVRVDMQLLGLEASRNAGLVQVGASSRVQVRLDFSGSDGRLLRSEVYNGTDERRQALVGLMGMVRESIDASIINCMTNVARDAQLVVALRGGR